MTARYLLWILYYLVAVAIAQLMEDPQWIHRCTVEMTARYLLLILHYLVAVAGRGGVMEDPQWIHNCRDDGAVSIVDPLLPGRSCHRAVNEQGNEVSTIDTQL